MEDSGTLFNSSISNSTLYNGPIVQSIPEQVSTIASNTTGIVANAFVLAVFLRCRELWNTRNLCWLFVMFCNFGIIAQSTIGFLSYAYQDLTLCKTFVLIFGTSYAQLTNCLFLATLDRFVALKCPIWYKRRITVKHLVALQITLAFFTVVVMTSPYWSTIQPLTCAAQRSGTFFYIFIVYSQLLYITSIVLHVKIYFIIRDYVRKNPAAFQNNYLVVYRSEIISNVSSYKEAPLRNSERNTKQHNRTRKPVTIKDFRNKSTEGPDSAVLTKPELRAAITLAVGILPILAVLLPSGLLFVYHIFCAVTKSCVYSEMLTRIFRQVNLWQVLYSPVIYCCTSMEFKKALRRFIKRYCIVLYK